MLRTERFLQPKCRYCVASTISPTKRDQNEMGGFQKRDRFWCASCSICSWTCWCSLSRFNIRHLVLEWCSRLKTKWGGKKRGPKRDQTPPRQETQPLPSPGQVLGSPKSERAGVVAQSWWKSPTTWEMRLKRDRGDSLHLYWAHRINKSHRSYGFHPHFLSVQKLRGCDRSARWDGD